MKPFFVVYVPISILTFIILNRLFHIFSKKQFSKFIRIYYFWLQLLVIIIQRNTYALILFSLNHVLSLFSTSYKLYVIHFTSVLIIGIMLISLLCFTPISIYFYRKQSKYFLCNSYPLRRAFAVSFYINIFKPIIESTTHTLFYNSPLTQIYILTLISIMTISVYIVSETKWKLFKVKGIFWI